MDDPGREWWLTDPGELLWQDWGAEFAVFSRLSGETHMLSVLPAEVLRQVSKGPRQLFDLADDLAVACDLDSSLAWQHKIGGILEDLRSLELVEKRT